MQAEQARFFIEKQISFDNGQSARTFVCADEASYHISIDIMQKDIYELMGTRNITGKEPKVVVDIGANMGAFSVLAHHVWPGSRILAFEPGGKAFECLARNVDGLPGIEVFHFGLGKGDHDLFLHSSIWGTVGASVGDSGTRTEGDEAIKVRDAGAVMAEMEVQEIDIIKIDTEGCEIPILESLGEMLGRTRVVFLEYHSDEDRIALDAMLRASHCLHTGKANSVHRGESRYLRRDIATRWDYLRITVP